MRRIHRPLGGHPRNTWMGLLAVLILASLPVLAASTLSAPAAQTMDPVSYLPLVLTPPRYEIAYISYRNGNLEIFKINADGSNQTNLTNNPANDGGWSSSSDWLAWSPDGRQIAFVSYRDNSNEIYVMNADGSHQTDLSNSPARDTNPIWSPDGRQIAFQSDRDGTSAIYVMNADGSNLTRLTSDLQGGRSPVLSPDWHTVAFQVLDRCQYEFCDYDIYIMNVDGSGRTNLTPGPGNDYNPVWSPDGRQIAFTSRYNLYVMNADGSNKTKLSTDRGVAEEYAWSPNGRQLAFLVYDGVGQWWFDVVNADGSGLTELPECRNPAWSPDGHQIACAGIYVMNADGSHRIKLTNDSESNWGPVWSPPLK